MDLRDFLRGLPVFGAELPLFDPVTAPPGPEELFARWLAEAVDAGVRGPHAMTLSTQGLDGVPNARVVMLRNLDDDGWRFATARLSPKGREVERLPAAALTFFWPEQGRQVRVRGPVTVSSGTESAADFLSRSPATRAEALTAHQSEILPGRADLELAAGQAAARIAADPGLVMPEWALYSLCATEVEFWQADANRRHVRLRYLRDGDSWQRDELWP